MGEMVYKKIDGVGLPVSEILFGSAGDLLSAGKDGTDLLDEMFSLGINTIDTARRYGYAERSIGDWMEKRQNRNQLVLLSKCAHPFDDGEKRVNRNAILQDLDVSLGFLRTDFIDIYLLHRDDPEVPVGEIVEIMNELRDRGNIGIFGGSNWRHERIEEANEYADAHHLQPFTVSSPNFGLAAQLTDMWGGGCVSISGSKEADAREWYRKNQMPVVSYSSLGRGFFSGKLTYADREKASEVLDRFALYGYGYEENYERLRRTEELAKEKGVSVPEIAMNWIFHRGINTFAVVSTSSKRRMEQNINALSLHLTDAERDYINLERDNY